MELLATLWPVLLTLATIAIDVVATGHAVLYKRDSRSAIAWVGFIWFVPIVGSLLYLWLGINRIQRRARSLRADHPAIARPDVPYRVAADCASVWTLGPHFPRLVRLVGEITHFPLLAGAAVEPLFGGDALPRMLQAIQGARRSVTLSTYIFDNDAAGRQFVAALGAAVERGVQVRVIVDDVGAKYSWPTILGPLRKARVPAAAFMPKLVPLGFPYANLRSHRKILVVDGTLGFTGGMNIRQGHMLDETQAAAIDDVHFQVTGPVVAHLQYAFAEDWSFCRGEKLEGEAWFPPLAEQGPTLARGIPDGPDEDFDNLRTTILGALACAQHSVRVVTPYFLPDTALVTALNLASMRGVQVDILLPEVNNLRLVQWASTAQLWQVLQRGCRVWLTPPPFDHSKLMVVDDAWSLVGSTNWDPRSLRLNFEFNMECYDAQLAAALAAQIDRKLRTAHRVTLEEVDGRALPIRLRDGLARLLSPYL